MDQSLMGFQAECLPDLADTGGVTFSQSRIGMTLSQSGDSKKPDILEKCGKYGINSHDTSKAPADPGPAPETPEQHRGVSGEIKIKNIRA